MALPCRVWHGHAMEQTPQSAYARLSDEDKGLINSQLMVMAIAANSVVGVPGHEATSEQLALDAVAQAMKLMKTETDTPELTAEGERILESMRELYAREPMLSSLRQHQQTRPQTEQELSAWTRLTDQMIAVDGDQHDPQRDLPWVPPGATSPQR